MKAWHFLKDNGAMRWKCGSVLKPKVGQTLRVDPDKLKLCKFGLHASKRAIDALEYAPGAIICRVEVGGLIIHGDDKLVASERTIIAMADATDTLHEMACWSAERTLELIKNPDPRSVAAIAAKRAWVRGEITDKKLDAARDAAWDAAWVSAWVSTWDAARIAARDAAKIAAREGAARVAARGAARVAAWDAARVAARVAAGVAAGGAAWDAQNHKLTTMLNRLLR